MRINFIIAKAGLSGGNRVVAIYAKKLSERGHEVTVVCPANKKHSLKNKIISMAKGRRIDQGGKSHFELMGVNVKFTEIHRAVLDSDVPDGDIVIANWWETAEWVDAFSERKGKKVYFIQGYEIFPGLPKERVERTYQNFKKKIVIAQWLKNKMVEKYPSDSLALIPNSVDAELFYGPKKNKQSVPTIGFIFSNSNLKRCITAIRVVQEIKKIMPDLAVKCFGRTPPYGELLLPEYCEFTCNPPQISIRDIYSSSDVWLCTSTTEGFSLPLLEAMACRTPVVSTRCGGPEDFVIDGVNGFLADVESIEQLVGSTIKLLNMEEQEWQSFSKAAYITATKYSWDDAADLFEKTLYKFRGDD